MNSTDDLIRPYEVFISYARADNQPVTGDQEGWAQRLRREIIAAHQDRFTTPMRVFLDQDEIDPGQQWRLRLIEGLLNSRILLVCLSPNYFKSDNCLWEWEQFHRHKAARRLGYDTVSPVYFVEAPDSEDQIKEAFLYMQSRGGVVEDSEIDFIPRWREWRTACLRSDFTDLREWFAKGERAMAEMEVQGRLKRLTGTLSDRIGRARRIANTPGNLREMNPCFVGRDQEMTTLHEQLLGQGALGIITAVNGLGGQGKTEFAISYAHSHADRYPAGLWMVRAEGRRELLPLIGELADDPRFGAERIVAGETPQQRGLRVLLRLASLARESNANHPKLTTTTLLILDNVSEPGLLSKVQLRELPEVIGLRMIATTRHESGRFSRPEDSMAFLEIGSLTLNEGVELIRRHQRARDPEGRFSEFPNPAEDEPAARSIVRELGGFTLAIECVAIHLGLHPDTRPANYLAELERAGLFRRAEHLVTEESVPESQWHAEQGSGPDLKSIREKQLGLILDHTIRSLSHLPDRIESAAALTALDFAALLPSDSIPWAWLRALASESIPELQGQNVLWEDACRRLKGLRLLVPGDHDSIARQHRMLRDHTLHRNRFREVALTAQLSTFAQSTTARLSRSSEWGKIGAIWELRSAGMLAEDMLASERAIGVELAAFIAHPLIEHWELDMSERILRRALNFCDHSEGVPKDQHASILSSLGGILRERQMWTAAEPLITKAISMARQFAPGNHLGLARKLNNHAMLLGDLRRQRAAEAVFKEALQLIAKCLDGPEDKEARIESAIISNNLGDLFKRKGHFRQAVAMFCSASAGLASILGKSHPDVATADYNLALLQYGLSEFEKARKGFASAVKTYSQVFGAGHIRTVASRLHEAVTMFETGEQSAALHSFAEAFNLLRIIPEDARYQTKNIESWVSDYHRMASVFASSFESARHDVDQLMSDYPLQRWSYQMHRLPSWSWRVIRWLEHIGGMVQAKLLFWR